MALRECLICESNKDSNFYCTLDGSDYLLCDSCGLIYVDHLEPTDKIYTAYSGGWLKSLRRKIMAPLRKLHNLKSFDSSMERANRITDFSFQHASVDRGKYLDVGCNKGFLLVSAIKKGWDIYGAEIVPELTDPFKNTYKEYSDRIHVGRFCDVRPAFDNNTFDLITAIDVIEHFEDPVADIAGIYEILKPGGKFVIQTPEADCEQAKQLVEKWGGLKPLEHLHLFTADNLKTFSHRLGFENYEVFEPFEQADGNFVAVMQKPL